MKKTIKISLMLVVLAICVYMIYAIYNNKLRISSTVNHINPDIVLSFSVLGDVHGQDKKLKSAIDDLYDLNPKMDAMILNGDTVDQGLDEQYSIIQKCLDKNKRYLPQFVIKNIGNHEFFNYDKGVNSEPQVKELISRYLKFSGEQSVFHDTWINGYHFISLGSEKTHTSEINSVQAFISQEQQRWLESKLSEEYKTGKPIFVFLHQPLNANTTSSSSGWVGVRQDAEIKSILSKYPEVVLFTSHTHADLSMGNMASKQAYTSVHTGAIYYQLMRDSTGGRKTVQGTQGLYVEVYKDKVVIKGRDFDNSKWINEADATLNTN